MHKTKCAMLKFLLKNLKNPKKNLNYFEAMNTNFLRKLMMINVLRRKNSLYHKLPCIQTFLYFTFLKHI